MNYEANTTKERFDEIKKNPLLFCHLTDKTEYEVFGRPYTKTGWFSSDSTITLFISDDQLRGKKGDRKLFVIGDEIIKTGNKAEEKKSDKDIVYFNINIFDPKN